MTIHYSCIKWYDQKKGYGFITPLNPGDADVFSITPNS